MRSLILSLAFLFTLPMASAQDAAKPKGPDSGQRELISGSDILIRDLRWPRWDNNTYFMLFNAGFTGGTKKKPGMYGGCRTRNGPPSGWFCTFFGTMTGAGVGRYFSGGGSGGRGVEGAGGGFKGSMREFKTNRWYRVVVRTYNPKRKDKIGKEGYWGWWMKDVHNGIWYYCGTANLMDTVTGFNRGGVGATMEAMGTSKHPPIMDIRFAFGRKDGQWYKINKFDPKGGKQRLIEDGTVSQCDAGYKGEAPPATQYFRKSPDQPEFDPIIIEKTVATGYGKQVSVSWSVPETSSPQLGRRIELFAQAGAKGDPILVNDENTSWLYGRRFDLPVAAKSVRLTVIDIFNREKSVVFPVVSAKPTPAQDVAGKPITNGLLFKFYKKPKSKERWWTKLPDLSTLEVTRQGHVSALTVAPKAGAVWDESSAFLYSGYLKVPVDGLYMLQAGTMDGNKLSIDGKVVLHDDGIHRPVLNAIPLAMNKGLHRFDLEFFSKGRYSNVKAKWEGPGFELRSIGRDDFVCDNSGGIPRVDIEVKSPKVVDGTLEDNWAQINVKTNLEGHTLNYLDLMVGSKVVYTSNKLDPGGNCSFSALLPKGNNEYWVRMLYDGNQYCMSREMLTLNVKEHLDDGPWTFEYRDNGIAQPASARFKDGKMSLMGLGTYFAYQEVTGDFTLTGRIAEIFQQEQFPGMTEGWMGVRTERGGAPYALFLTNYKRKWRTVPNHRDLGSSRVSSELPMKDPSHRWMRFVRKGTRYSVYTSAEGKQWEKVAERLSQGFAKDPKRVGFYLEAKIKGSKPVSFGTIDQISLEKTSMPEPPRVKPSSIELSLKNRITGVVQCVSKPDTMYARSPSRGVLVSSDRGETWKDANGNLKAVPEAMAVRSIAVHPEKPGLVLRGGGALIGGKLKSGLWKTVDAGKTWKLVSDKIDFDGTGPTALFGEVISISRRRRAQGNRPELDMTNLCVAGGESSGLFASHNFGDTWKQIDHSHATKLFVGDRITALAFKPVPGANGKDLNTLVVGTFADSEFEALGLGKPHVQVANGETGGVISGRIRKLPDAKGFVGSGFRGGEGRIEGLGVTGVAVDCHYLFYTAATTRGVYYHFPGGALDQLRFIPADGLTVALGVEVVPIPFKRGRHKGKTVLELAGYTAPFSSKGNNRIGSFKERAAYIKAETESKLVDAPDGAYVSSGLTCMLPDALDYQTIFFCNTYGIFKSTDAGKTFKRVCKSTVLK